MISSESETARFYAYFNYLIALSQLINIEYPNHKIFVTKYTKTKGFKKICGKRLTNNIGLEKNLRLSWFNEILLLKKKNYDDLLPFSLPWSMVQCYYTIYPMIRSYFFAQGRNISKSHEKTLSTIGSDLFAYKGRFPEPWCCLLEDDPRKENIKIKSNFGDYLVNITNPLRSPYLNDPREFFGLFLKTTRQRKSEKFYYQWRKEKQRKRMPEKEKLAIISKMRHTHIFDCLYRLRSRANYQDADSFIFSGKKLVAGKDIQDSITIIVSYTLLLFEIIICKSIGKKEYQRIVDEFISSEVGINGMESVYKRWGFINSSF